MPTTLYHGTSEMNLLNILKTGFIIPKKDFVYLTDTQPTFYACKKSIEQNCCRGAILEIKTNVLDHSKLYFNEHVCEELCSEKDENIPNDWSKEKKVDYYKKIIMQCKEEDLLYWEKSLEYGGSCSYHGVIPLDFCSRAVIYDLHYSFPFIFQNCDNITLSNFYMHAIKYRNLTKWLFNDSDIINPYKPWEPASWPPSSSRDGIIIYEKTT